jgi:hypothetical protein
MGDLEKTKILLLNLEKEKKEIESRICEGKRFCEKLENQIYYKRLEEIENNLGGELIERLTIKFLKRMEFENINYGDVVSVGASGKRPYGNSFIEGDIVECFKSEKKLTDKYFVVDDYLSNKGWDLYSIIKHKIPYLLNKIILNY